MENEKIGSFIKKLREEKNLTQEELARLIPIGRGAVSKWERGVTIPDSITLLKLSEIFNVSINEILLGKKSTIGKEKELYNKSQKNFVILIVTIVILLLLYFYINFIIFFK